jgi:hypothetical protein
MVDPLGLSTVNFGPTTTTAADISEVYKQCGTSAGGLKGCTRLTNLRFDCKCRECNNTFKRSIVLTAASIDIFYATNAMTDEVTPKGLVSPDAILHVVDDLQDAQSKLKDTHDVLEGATYKDRGSCERGCKAARGHWNIYRIVFAASMRRILPIIMRHRYALAFLPLFFVCTCHRPVPYGPKEISVSPKRLASVQVGSAADIVRKQLGSPSFIWSSKEFSSQRYPKSNSCSARDPATMWVYYNVSEGSACLYFDVHGNLVCVERNDILIAQ